MKRIVATLTLCLLMLTLLAACDGSQPAQTTGATTAPATEGTNAPTAEATQPATEPQTTETEPVRDEVAYYTNEVYAQQIGQFYTAISEKWDADAYMSAEMSDMASYYYEGDALENMGYTFMDLDGNGVSELIIGVIQNAENSPLVLEIWTVKNDEPVKLVQSGSRNRYFLQHDTEADQWTVAYEAENGAANHAVYYLMLVNGEFEVGLGFVFDAMANESAPWFMTNDMDWDVSNDTPTDEATVNEALEVAKALYAAADYIPFSQFK